MDLDILPNVDDLTFGMFQSVLVGSTLVAMLVAGKASKLFNMKQLIRINILLQTSLLFLLALITTPVYIQLYNTFWGPMITLLILACIFTIIAAIGNIAFGTLFQKIVPSEMLGRVGSVMGSVCMAAMPLGQAVFGFAFDKAPIALVVLIGAGIMLLLSIYTLKNIREEDIQATKAQEVTSAA